MTRTRRKLEEIIQFVNNVCVQRNIPVTNHTNINSKQHLNVKKLRLNDYWKSIFIKNLKKKKNWKDFDWQSEVDDQQVCKISPSWIVSENDSLSALVSIKAQSLEDHKNLFTGNLNINSIRNKFEILPIWLILPIILVFFIDQKWSWIQLFPTCNLN